jgi:hypothetical protein
VRFVDEAPWRLGRFTNQELVDLADNAEPRDSADLLSTTATRQRRSFMRVLYSPPCDIAWPV